MTPPNPQSPAPDHTPLHKAATEAVENHVTGGVKRQLDPWEINERNDIMAVITPLFDQLVRERDALKVEYESRVEWIAKMLRVLDCENHDGFNCKDPHEVAATLRAEVERLRQDNHNIQDNYRIAQRGLDDLRAQLTAAQAKLAVAEEMAGALKRTEEFLEECEVAEDRSNLDGDSAETVLNQINDGAEEGLKQVRAALAKWNAVNKEEGK